MDHWKTQLYRRYVSSGQASVALQPDARLTIRRYPYYRQIIRKHLPADKSLWIADVACGHGALLHCLRESGYRNLKGVDVSSEQVALAHKLGVVEAQCGDMADFLRGNPDAFEVVFLMDILEHLDRGELFKMLDLVNRSLKSGGKLIVHVPNGAGLFGMRIRYGDLTHENCFTPQSMHQALVSSGFDAPICYEDKPVIHGLKSFVRYLLWESGTIPFRLILLAETGSLNHILSQNMLIVVQKL